MLRVLINAAGVLTKAGEMSHKQTEINKPEQPSSGNREREAEFFLPYPSSNAPVCYGPGVRLGTKIPGAGEACARQVERLCPSAQAPRTSSRIYRGQEEAEDSWQVRLSLAQELLKSGTYT